MIMVCLFAIIAASLSAKAQEVTIDLYPGWNWISYPMAEVLDINTALGDFVPVNGDKIKSQFSNSTYLNGQWRGGVTHFMPGWGYMYYSNRTDIVSFVFGEPAPQLIVTTAEPTEITATSAVVGGTVNTVDGNYASVQRGICWGLNPNPTFNDNYIETESGIGNFSISLTNLDISAIYYIRAYAVTANETYFGEEKSFTTRDGIPILMTSEITNITGTSAIGGGNIIDDGGSNVTERGICWSINPNPTISDSYTINESGIGIFTCSITNLTVGTIYYVRAYATNSFGTTYGNELSFTTMPLPLGAINGLFSVNETQQVYFSQGNLQYQASTNTWRFADNQYDYIGDTNSYISMSYNGWIDLYGWGTSGYNHGANCYQPWNVSTNDRDYYAYGYYYCNLYDQNGEADWGCNQISNGGNMANAWRTLTTNEWIYVLNTRNTPSGIRYAKAQVNGVNGLILLPDDWNTAIYNLNSTNMRFAYFSSNTISAIQWMVLENAGAVFLPAAGNRNGFSVNSVGSGGCYWSASYSDGTMAYCINIVNSDLALWGTYGRSRGLSVRLVCPAE